MVYKHFDSPWIHILASFVTFVAARATISLAYLGHNTSRCGDLCVVQTVRDEKRMRTGE